MQHFIHHVAQEIVKKEFDLTNTIVITPNKRPHYFLKQSLKTLLQNETYFLPELYDIESFAEKASGLQIKDTFSILLTFYEVYKKQTPPDKQDNFITFSGWAQTLIHDYSDIEHALVDENDVFSYIKNVKEYNHWYFQQEKTFLQKQYIEFWERIKPLYDALRIALLNQKIAYQGLAYKTATQNIDRILSSKPNIILAGFNALTKAEERLFNHLLDHYNTSIYWDTDAYYMEQNKHPATHFIKKHIHTWQYYKRNPKPVFKNEYEKPKEIEIISTSNVIGQIYHATTNIDTQQKDTILMMSDNHLLSPLLEATDTSLYNITIGYPISDTLWMSLVEQFIISSTWHEAGCPLSHFTKLLQHHKMPQKMVSTVLKRINSSNKFYISIQDISDLEKLSPKIEWQKILPPKEKMNGRELIQRLQYLIQLCTDHEKTKSDISLQATKNILQSLFEIDLKINQHDYLDDFDTVAHIITQTLKQQKLLLDQNPNGIQVMSLLETRILDCQHLIITSANEGVLPPSSISDQNSFIPYQLKQELGMDTSRRTHNIYAYYLYRLLQRTPKVTIYHTADDQSNSSELSRYILQLIHESPQQHQISYTSLVDTPYIKDNNPQKNNIHKDAQYLEILKEKCQSGLSPSFFSSYMYNPVQWYQSYLLKLSEYNYPSTQLLPHQHGTIIHDVLEQLYTPKKGVYLEEFDIKDMLNKYPAMVLTEFQKICNPHQGPNHILYHVTLTYIKQFLTQELQMIEKGHQIKILDIESTLPKCELRFENLDFPIYLYGKIDRIDELDGCIRIIDYKTGNIEPALLHIKDWETPYEDLSEKFRYPLQLMIYSYLATQSRLISEEQIMSTHIMSFGNLSKGYMPLKLPDGNTTYIASDINPYTEQILQQIVQEMMNTEISIGM